jgi:hypothetical protein
MLQWRQKCYYAYSPMLWRKHRICTCKAPHITDLFRNRDQWSGSNVCPFIVGTDWMWCRIGLRIYVYVVRRNEFLAPNAKNRSPIIHFVGSHISVKSVTINLQRYPYKKLKVINSQQISHLLVTWPASRNNKYDGSCGNRSSHDDRHCGLLITKLG